MYEKRFEKLAELLPKDADAALLTSSVSRKYFTGLTTTAGMILVTRDFSALIIDTRYIEVARQAAKGFEVILQDNLNTQLPQILHDHGVKTICVEEAYVTLKQFENFETMLKDITVLKNAGLSEVIDSMRRVKSPHELGFIKQAQNIADKGFTEILNHIKPGRTELEIALELEYITRQLGSEGASFDFIVVSGANTSRPHGHPTDKEIQQGDLVTMDFGCIFNGYHSDMTRTVAVGNISDAEKEMYNTVLAAQLAALEGVAPGKTGMEVDQIARKVIEDAGYGQYFTHGLGHSLGLEIHEDPRFAPSWQGTIEVGNVMSVEPGIYIEGKFGCRIEDIIYIGSNGIENLCTSSKELIIL